MGAEGKRSKKQKSRALALFIVFSISIISIFFARIYLIEQVNEYDIYLNVDDIAGFNISVSKSSLYFGTAPPSSKLSRDIIFDNDYESKKVIIKSYGEIKDWITVSENRFILEGNSNKTIKIDVFIPSDAEYGRHSGKLKIVFIRNYN